MQSGGMIFEYNYVSNVALIPGSGNGAAPVYLWGTGWSFRTNIFRFNWLYSNWKCYYLDGTTSNQYFEGNICYDVKSEINNGRYNIFKNNIFLAFWSNKIVSFSQLRLCEINLSMPPAFPTTWQTCANNYNNVNLNQGNYYTCGMPWAGHVSPNGTLLRSYNPSELLTFKKFPWWNWSEWCTPTTAGPKKVSCADINNRYWDKGIVYNFTCEMLPSNNRFGDENNVGFYVM
jgi:hypothetical protein